MEQVIYFLSLSETYKKKNNSDGYIIFFVFPYHILQIYMSMGGIPHYLKEIKTGWTATQAIDNICFSETGLFKNEFSKLYQALFEHPEAHEAVVRALP